MTMGREARSGGGGLGRAVGRRYFGNLMYGEEMRAMRDAGGDSSGPGCGSGCLVAFAVAVALFVLVFLLV